LGFIRPSVPPSPENRRPSQLNHYFLTRPPVCSSLRHGFFLFSDDPVCTPCVFFYAFFPNFIPSCSVTVAFTPPGRPLLDHPLSLLFCLWVTLPGASSPFGSQAAALFFFFCFFLWPFRFRFRCSLPDIKAVGLLVFLAKPPVVPVFQFAILDGSVFFRRD